MESRNVKIIDEHGIDRDAHIICGLKISNVDYVLYSIERDEENNNLFISKVMNNFDGTSNMINIEDTMEKNKLNDIVKQLVTYAINNDDDKTTGTVNLSNGTEVIINSLVFNKEQNINVTKTYITTVKKNVVKVCENFYDVPMTSSASQESPFFDTVKDDIFADKAAPLAEEMVMPEVNIGAEPTVVEPILPVPPVQDIPTVEAVSTVNEQTPLVTTPVEPILPMNDSSAVSTSSVASSDTVVPVESVEPAPINNDLVFDASKETNLNQALGEISTKNAVSVSDVNSLRDFGQDNALNNEQLVQPVLNNDVLPQVTNSNGGFANKKFFMVIAILFFVAACVFLGYEAFMYFQLTK